MSLRVKHLLGIKDLSRADVELILDTAATFKEVINRPIKKVPSLRDITIANVFFENSTRTRLSFELAEKRLSADVVHFSSSGSSAKKGETLLDTVNNILAMKVDMIVMRHSSPGAPHFLSKHITANIVNAGDGTHEHPTQALLDAFSLREKFGTLEGKKIAIIGDILHSRVALSNIFCLQKLGAEVMVCGPITLIPKYIAELGVQVTYDVRHALAWCDAANWNASKSNTSRRCANTASTTALTKPCSTRWTRKSWSCTPAPSTGALNSPAMPPTRSNPSSCNKSKTAWPCAWQFCSYWRR